MLNETMEREVGSALGTEYVRYPDLHGELQW